MQIEIICVGKLKEEFWKNACNEYTKRLSRFCRLHITELKDESVSETASEAQIEKAVEAEGERILQKLLPRDYIVTLCVEGKSMASPGFAEQLERIAQSGSGRLVLIIGGSCGLSDAVKNKSQLRLSFSEMTFPHQLMRVILLEQVYRAFKINAHESYHK